MYARVGTVLVRNLFAAPDKLETTARTGLYARLHATVKSIAKQTSQVANAQCYGTLVKIPVDIVFFGTVCGRIG